MIHPELASLELKLQLSFLWSWIQTSKEITLKKPVYLGHAIVMFLPINLIFLLFILGDQLLSNNPEFFCSFSVVIATGLSEK